MENGTKSVPGILLLLARLVHIISRTFYLKMVYKVYFYKSDEPKSMGAKPPLATMVPLPIVRSS